MDSGAGRVVVISGPSGVGKTTLSRRLLEDPRLARSVTATTRLPRPGEVNGRDYHFLSAEEFAAWENQGEFLETAETFGRRYGTPRRSVAAVWNQDRVPVLDIDYQGVRRLRELGYRGVFIQVRPPALDALKERLAQRGTSAEELARRVARAQTELDQASLYDYQVINDDVERALGEIRGLLQRDCFGA